MKPKSVSVALLRSIQIQMISHPHYSNSKKESEREWKRESEPHNVELYLGKRIALSMIELNSTQYSRSFYYCSVDVLVLWVYVLLGSYNYCIDALTWSHSPIVAHYYIRIIASVIWCGLVIVRFPTYTFHSQNVLCSHSK